MSQPDHDCLFCAIAAGDRPGHVVSSDEVAVAFLDVRPLFKGHVLVASAGHVQTLADLPADQVGPFFGRVQAMAVAVERAMNAAGTFVAVNNKVSQSIPHLHMHVVPRNRKDGLRGFFWPRTTYTDGDEAADYAARIRDAL